MAAAKENKYAQKWELEELIELFIVALEYAEENDSCLSLGDAIYQTGIPYSTYDYKAEEHKVLGSIKKDTKTAVARRINNKALHNEYNSTASIWRMKQLGETDRTEVKQTIVEEKPITQEEIDQLDNDY